MKGALASPWASFERGHSVAVLGDVTHSPHLAFLWRAGSVAVGSTRLLTLWWHQHSEGPCACGSCTLTGCVVGACTGDVGRVAFLGGISTRGNIHHEGGGAAKCCLAVCPARPSATLARWRVRLAQCSLEGKMA